MEWVDFILAHEGDDLGKLALARERYVTEVEDFDLALTTLEVRRKLREKVPQWYAVPSLRFPLRVSGEQCSSAETARYKATVAAAAAKGCLADLTGGLGVDSWAFAQVFDRVLYNEMRPELADAARHNFAALGLTNVTVSCAELAAGKLPLILGSFHPDILFLDPARRASDGRKVFRLEDCQPDVLQLLPELLSACPLVLLKLSPMADISLVCKQLGCVKAVHVVGAEGECKEMLLLLDREWNGGYTITAYENGSTLTWSPEEESAAAIQFASAEDLTPGHSSGTTLPSAASFPAPPSSPAGFLFEPGKALMKAGAFRLLCGCFGLKKLDTHTHLYVTEAVPAELAPLGKTFRILETLPLDKRTMKEAGRRYPRAEVTARNIPMTSDELRKRLGCGSGGDIHLFGVRTAAAGNVLLIAKEL